MFCQGLKTRRHQFSKTVYNNLVSMTCGNILTQFWFYGPIIKYRYPSKMDLKSYKSVLMRSIPKEQKFAKGSKYVLFEMNLQAFSQFCTCDLSDPDPLEIQTFDTKLTIKKNLQEYNLSIFSSKINRVLLEFPMKEEEFAHIKKFGQSSLPYIYGLEDMFEFQRRKVLGKVSKQVLEEIEDSEQKDYFIL